jgi:hypothetical protein
LRATENNRATRRVKLCSNGIVARVSPIPDDIRLLPAIASFGAAQDACRRARTDREAPAGKFPGEGYLALPPPKLAHRKWPGVSPPKADIGGKLASK